MLWGFPGGSAGNESTCNAGDPTSILGWGRSPGESDSSSVMSYSSWLHGLYSPWNSPGQNTGVGSLSLLQGIFPTQGSNPGLLHCRWILYQLSHKGSPDPLEKRMANGYPLQYSCMENFNVRGAGGSQRRPSGVHGVTKSQTQLGGWHFTFSRSFWFMLKFEKDGLQWTRPRKEYSTHLALCCVYEKGFLVKSVISPKLLNSVSWLFSLWLY